MQRRHCDAAGLVSITRVSFPLTNTFMVLSLSPDSSVYSKESGNKLHDVPRVIQLPAKHALPKPCPYVAVHRDRSCFYSPRTVNCVVLVCLGSRLVVDEGSLRVFLSRSIECRLADHGEAACRPSAIVSATEFHRWRVRPHCPGFQFVFDSELADHDGQLLHFRAWRCFRQTTERYLGCKQNLTHPVNDRFQIFPVIAGLD